MQHYDTLKKLYAQRGLTLAENGDLTTPAGHLTGHHVDAAEQSGLLTSVTYRSHASQHDRPQTYAVKDGAWVDIRK